MWTVLRRLQGEEHLPVEECQGVTKNLNHIARHACRSFNTEAPGNILTEPYGLNLYPKLVHTLSSEEQTLRVKALEALLGIFGNKQDHVVRSVQYGVVQALVQRLKDPCGKARALAGECLMHVVATDLGLEEVLREGFETNILDAVDDEEPKAAVEAFSCIAAMDHTVGCSRGTEALIAAKCVPKYIAKAQNGPPAVTERALVALCKVLNVKEAFIRVLEEGAMETLVSLLSSPNHGVLEQACETIARLCFFSAGKRAAVKLNVLEKLKPLLGSSSSTVRRSATAALMTITLDNDGKKQALEKGVVASLTTTLGQEEDEQALINMLKAVTNCAESPKARLELATLLPAIKRLQDSSNALLSRSATRAAYMVEWTPGSTAVYPS